MDDDAGKLLRVLTRLLETMPLWTDWHVSSEREWLAFDEACAEARAIEVRLRQIETLVGGPRRRSRREG